MANILTTKEQVKNQLEDLAGTSSFDALLDAIILAVSQRFEAAANRKLFTATRVELHNGGVAKIHVNAPPITSITEIIYGEYYNFTDGTVLVASEYQLDPSEKKNVIYSTVGCFPGGEHSLRVTYVGGYIGADQINTNIPELLQNAAAIQSAYIFKNRKTIGIDNVNIGDGVISKVTNRWFLPDVLDVIRTMRYRNIY